MFATMLYLTNVLVADYILTLLTALSSDGVIMPLPIQPVWKIAKKSFKHRIYVKFVITKASLLRAGFARSG